jgi:alpha-L-fucosidase
MTDEDLGSRVKLTPGSHLWWFPAEVNTSILHGWFWAHGKQVKTGADLVDLYYRSVGRNGNMLLNLAPDTRGLIPDDQIASLEIMARVKNQTFAHDLSAGATITADSSAPSHLPGNALDKNLDTWWEAAPGQLHPTLTLTLPSPRTFDVLMLQEAMDHRGQRIESFTVDAWEGAAWKPVDRQTTIGHKRLLRWDTPVTTDRIRIHIQEARLEPALAEIGLFKQAEVVAPPVISPRAKDGTVTLRCVGNLRAVYTLDGTMPSPRSMPYTTPVAMPEGGDLNAACLDADGQPGMAASRHFPGFVQTGWTIVSPHAQNATEAFAIDDDKVTLWQASGGAPPRTITVDMQVARDVGGVYYLPRHDGVTDGIVETFRLETSLDGMNWQTAIENGRFDNIRNNPILQEMRFSSRKARYFRLGLS